MLDSTEIYTNRTQSWTEGKSIAKSFQYEKKGGVQGIMSTEHMYLCFVSAVTLFKFYQKIKDLSVVSCKKTGKVHWWFLFHSYLWDSL